jgi:hypothetical protein
MIFLLTITFYNQALAVETGGEFKILLAGVLQEDGSFDNEILESLNLELFLPQIGNNEIRYEFKINNLLQDLLAGDNASYFTKKLYIKHKFDNFHLTLGRQPVSWSFGSLLNPVDYTLGAVALDEENNNKYTDALETYIPINWNSSLSIITSFPSGFSDKSEEMKWGVRGRMGVKDYDLTLNYVQEAEMSNQVGENFQVTSVIPKQRLGLTLKGDIGNLGVYSSFGHYFDDRIENSNSYLLGADYSYNLNYYTKINMQVEYLGIDFNSLRLEQMSYLNIDNRDNRLSLLTGSISYPIDDFSSISLTTIVSLNDSSLMLNPSYQNILPGNINLDISTSIFLGKEDSLFGPVSQMPQLITSISMSYLF